MEVGEGQVIECHTDTEWEENFNKGIESNKLVVAYFIATWCAPCRLISPVVVKYAQDFPQVIFLKVDVDELGTVAAKYQVRATPTFIFLKEGETVDTYVGADPSLLKQLITKYAGAGAGAATVSA